MLDVLLGQVLSCSFMGSYVIIAVMVARSFLKKSPKMYAYALWSVVFFRLLVPVTLESPFGILPATLESPFAILPETQSILPLTQETGTISQEKTEHQGSTEVSPQAPFSSMEVQDSVPNSTSVLSILWCMGMSILVIPSLFSVVKLKKQLRVSFHLEKNIYLVDSIDTPFVWGLWKPKIYLPSTLNEDEKECVIPHEEYHLKRFDHITRLLAFFTLILHWFNPLVWCAFVLSGRDMELSVDEKVVKNLVRESPSTENESTIKKKYATLLLELGTKKSSFVPLYVTPTFRHGETKERVKNIMKMKKIKLWVSGLTGVLVLGLIVGFSSNQPHGLNFAYQKEQNTLSLEEAVPCTFYEDPLFMRKDGITIEIPQEFTNYHAQIGVFHNSGVATNQVFHKIQFLPSTDSMTDLENYQKEMEMGFNLLALTELKPLSQISVFPTEKQFIPFHTSSGETFSYCSFGYWSFVNANATPSIDPTGAGLRDDDSENEYWEYVAMFNHEKGTFWVHASVDTREELVGLEQLVLSLVDRAIVSSEGMSDPQGLDPEHLAVYFRIDNEGNEVEIPFEELFIDEKPW